MKFLALLFCVLFVLPAQSEITVQTDKLRTFGSDNKTIIYVFTSPSCPHCAAYHADILPKLRQQFADKGLAQIKIVDMPNTGDTGAVKASQLARCMTDEQYTTFMKAVYENQDEWAFNEEFSEKLKTYATQAGLSEKDYDVCFGDTKLKEAILAQRDNLARMYRVSAMPTTVVVRGLKNKSFLGADEEIFSDIQKVVEP